MDKTSMLTAYINEAEEILNKKDETAASRFIKEIVAVYDSEIPDVRSQLDTFGLGGLYDSSAPDYLGDVKLLKAKLMNYLFNLKSGLYKVLMAKDGSQNITVSQELSQVTNISFEQTIQNIQKIPDESLSAEEKVQLTERLASIYATKDKKSKWDKIREVLKWVAEKGIEVGIAALPYIAKSLE